MANVVAEWNCCQDCYTFLVHDELPSEWEEGDPWPLRMMDADERRRLVPGDKTDEFRTFYCVGHGETVAGECYGMTLYDR